MKEVLAWVAAHWEMVTACAVALVNIVNAITPSFVEKTGLKRLAYQGLDLLSVLASKDAPGTLKAPLSLKAAPRAPLEEKPEDKGGDDEKESDS